MNILVTMHECDEKEIYFPKETWDSLKQYGNVRVNDLGRPFTEEELAKYLTEVDICISHWWCPPFTEKVLKGADRLKLIAHAAGSVSPYVTDDVYRRRIKVCSANEIMAKFVAEGTLSYILAGLRQIPLHDSRMKSGGIWEQYRSESLFGKKVGLIGFGTVGSILVQLLSPFNVQIRVFDPYLKEDSLVGMKNISSTTLDELLLWADIISIHASQTPETFHLLNAKKLSLIRRDALLVNTARGSLIDESTLALLLEQKRFFAVLDVFSEEPLPMGSPLRKSENAILIPHMAGKPSRENLTYGMIDEIARFCKNEPLQYEIPYGKFRLMTR